VKRYLHEKISYVQEHATDDEHVLLVPGAESGVSTAGRTRVYTIAAPVVSRRTQYRVLLNLRAVGEIIAREQPDIIESSDPYQLGWKLAAISAEQRIPAVAFYHSHFSAAYLLPVAERLGRHAARTAMQMAAGYTRRLYNSFAATLVPSPPVAETLRAWGIANVRHVELGVNTSIFRPVPRPSKNGGPTSLLYVGRLGPEKNTGTLLSAFSILVSRRPGAFQLVVVGDGQQRTDLEARRAATAAIPWLPYVSDPQELAGLYRAADLFVHPGTQETFGLAALESQACGTPVVGIRGSAMDRIILHDQSCWAAENSAAALADAIEKCCAGDLRSLGNTAAAAVAQRYSWTHVFDDLFCIYRDVCRGYTQPQQPA
jgi:alpha-1,6-mannosyltransferase